MIEEFDIYVGGEVPVTQYKLTGSDELGEEVAHWVGDRGAVLMANHGLLTVGDCVEEAVGSFVHMERVAEVHMKARHAKPISPEAARYARADLRRFGPGRIAFGALVARHVGDPESAR